MKYLLMAFVVFAAGCTFQDGQPWGLADFSVKTNEFDRAGREEGEYFKTALNYGIEIETLEVEIESVGLALSAEGTGISEFDPANPPPGYSLCHNGHCHADSGELVDYEDIRRELSTAAGAAGIIQLVDERASVLSDSTIDVSGACTQDCQLDRGSITNVSAIVTAVTLKGTVVDLTDAERIDGERQIDLTWEISTTFNHELEVAVGDDDPGIALNTAFSLSPRTFDAVDFGQDPTTIESFLDGFERSQIDVKVKRYELD